MYSFSCSINFASVRSFEELEEEFSRRYVGGLRFIPEDRRNARDFARAEMVEYALFDHDLDLIWDEDYKHFRMFLGECENSLRQSQRPSMRHASLQRLLGILVRQIDGVHDIRINPNTAGPFLDVWQSRVDFDSRLTIQEVGALLAQQLFCGSRFVPTDAPTLRDATQFKTEHDLLGHEIILRRTPVHSHELSIRPSARLLSWLTTEENAILRGIDIRDWILAPFKNHPWIHRSSSHWDWERNTLVDDDVE